ncbi:TonB-dependent receptor [Phocoenobacter skyensis]|uniref:Iron complex outermembrane recepter protein n=1 Tax=Phocoenobacter skyensis TaxID=97481 RepID=A0A1H7VD81_9PAST|nr:TonB-dependent receptor [Pasteurella skyensis]MDP8079379.1 TonB-dependent receptor [Pasteurella skyensis]MDP8085251.1 TonB-dependent receptor [Pasteurella skyensis]MDP8184310.1 TonB-dependent receptor [Pasteurella skyensis]QLB23404.1 hypothetical protein A6B44_09380 [Pasteurella skyensis]SEM07222.1 iron complex outermembrane recepter protein [Pasteurella skyensis]
MRYSNISIGIVSIVFSSNIFALQTENSTILNVDKTPSTELGTIYVHPEYLEIEHLRNTKEIIVISKEQIQEKGHRTISDILAEVPSVSVGATGHGQIDIRGQGADQASRNIQVIVDGVPITALTNHPNQLNYDVIPVEQIERIEIIPGGGSVLYGSGASGGIVNITSSVKSVDNPVYSLSGESNSKGYRLNVNLGTRLNDNLAVTFNASKLNRDLHFVDTFRHSEYYSAGLSWDINDTQNLTVRASHLNEDSLYLENISYDKVKKYGTNYRPKIKNGKRAYLYGDRRQDHISVTYRYNTVNNISVISDAFYQKGFYVGVKELDKTVYTNAFGIRNKVKWHYMNGGELLIGIDGTVQKSQLEYYSYKKPKIFNYDKKVFAGYIANQLKWGNWETSQGIRRELTKWGFEKARYQYSIKENQIFNDTKNLWNTAFDLSLAYHYSDSGRVYARYERGYTVPDGIQVTDIVSSMNKDKKKIYHYRGTRAEPEKFNMYEIGLKDSFKFTTVNLVGWYSQTNNQMSRLIYRGNYETINALKTKRWGMDLSMIQQFGNLTLEESYSYLKGRTDYASDEIRKYIASKRYKGKTSNFLRSGLQKVPRHKVALRATYDFTDNLSATVRYTYQSKYENTMYQEDQEGKGNDQVKSFEIVDLSMKYQPRDWIQVYGGITNVFDKKYFNYSSGTGFSPTIVPGAERGYFLGLKAVF